MKVSGGLEDEAHFSWMESIISANGAPLAMAETSSVKSMWRGLMESSAKSLWLEVMGGTQGQTKVKYLKLTGMHKVENSRCANLEKYVPDPNLINLIFGGKPNGIRPPARSA